MGFGRYGRLCMKWSFEKGQYFSVAMIQKIAFPYVVLEPPVCKKDAHEV